MNIFSIAALVAMGGVMAGCAKVESTETLDNQQNDKIVTLTTTVGFSPETKALTDGGEKTFAEGEKIAVIYENESGNKVKAESVDLTAGDITNGGKSATFSVSLTNAKAGGSVKYIYPANMAGTTDVDYSKLDEQDGTLATIASNYDLAVFDGSLTAEAELPTSASLENKLALIAYTLKDADGTNDITGTITGMTVSDGTNSYSITRDAAAGPIYVAIQPTSGADIAYTATDGTKNYAKSVTGKTYAANNFYQLGLKMTEEASLATITSSDIGKVIGADGKLYASKTAAETASTTASAIVAYVGSAGSVETGQTYKGLALALTDANNGSTCAWYTENSGTCVSQSNSISTARSYMNGLAETNTLVNDGHTHAAASAARNYNVDRPTGASAWFLPSIGQWNKIVNGLTSTTTAFTTSANDALKGSAFSAKLTDAGGNALKSNDYWSSTVYNTNSAWGYSAGYGGAGYGGKTSYIYVRAAFAF